MKVNQNHTIVEGGQMDFLLYFCACIFGWGDAPLQNVHWWKSVNYSSPLARELPVLSITACPLLMLCWCSRLPILLPRQAAWSLSWAASRALMGHDNTVNWSAWLINTGDVCCDCRASPCDRKGLGLCGRKGSSLCDRKPDLWSLSDGSRGYRSLIRWSNPPWKKNKVILLPTNSHDTYEPPWTKFKLCQMSQ